VSALNQRLRNVAQDLINRLGTSAVLVERVYAVDKAESKSYLQSELREEVKVSPPEPFFKYVDGQNIATDELTCMLAAQSSAEPSLRQSLEVAGREYKILGVQPVYGGDLAVVYALRLSA
jgi:hypothetical protein